MAERPVFIPAPDAPGFVRELNLTIKWAGGFAVMQKRKNVRALHDAAKAVGIEPILEASTKSDEKLGQHLSAFNLKVKTSEGDLPLECAYQGSKVFERGGPYVDLCFTDPRSAKRDPRLHGSGRLVAFAFEGHEFPLEPKTVFYDWLYITALFPYRDWLDRLSRFAAFSDIEFNPQKSVNCQARSLALFVSLKTKHLLDDAVRSPESFIEITRGRMRPTTSPVAEAPTCPINSSAKPETASIAVEAEHFAKIPAELPVVSALASAESTGGAPQTTANVRDDKGVPSDFETFLREKMLRKPKQSGRKRNKMTARKRQRGLQGTVLDRSPGASE